MFYSRKDWGARPPEARYRLDPEQVEGVALHWPGMSTMKHTPAEVQSLLRSIQRDHMDVRGWSDIAYQEAFAQDGSRYQLRGIRHRSGANGDEDVNERFGAFLLVLAIGEKPSPAMIAQVRLRVLRFRHVFRGALRVVGHQDVRPEPTACPGPIVEDMIRRRLFEPAGPR